MRDVESEMDMNQKKEEERKTQGAPVRGKPITKTSGKCACKNGNTKCASKA